MALITRQQLARNATAVSKPARCLRSVVRQERTHSNRVVCMASPHRITVLSGDGIGPEITEIATKVLTAAGKAEGEEFIYNYQLMGGAAIDATGVPLPAETLAACKAGDSVLLAAIGG